MTSQNTSHRSFFTRATAVITACATAITMGLTVPQASAVQNGLTVDMRNHPAAPSLITTENYVAHNDRGEGYTYSRCSGTWIGNTDHPQWALIARHCLKDREARTIVSLHDPYRKEYSFRTTWFNDPSGSDMSEDENDATDNLVKYDNGESSMDTDIDTNADQYDPIVADDGSIIYPTGIQIDPISAIVGFLTIAGGLGALIWYIVEKTTNPDFTINDTDNGSSMTATKRDNGSRPQPHPAIPTAPAAPTAPVTPTTPAKPKPVTPKPVKPAQPVQTKPAQTKPVTPTSPVKTPVGTPDPLPSLNPSLNPLPEPVQPEHPTRLAHKRPIPGLFVNDNMGHTHKIVDIRYPRGTRADIALVQVESPVYGAYGVDIARTPLQVGDRIAQFGNGGPDRIMRWQYGTVVGFTINNDDMSSRTQIPTGEEFEVSLTTLDNNAMSIPGDSGGPLYDTTMNTLVAVNSGTMNTNALTHTEAMPQYSMGVPIAPYRDWIMESINS